MSGHPRAGELADHAPTDGSRCGAHDGHPMHARGTIGAGPQEG